MCDLAEGFAAVCWCEEWWRDVAAELEEPEADPGHPGDEESLCWDAGGEPREAAENE